MAAAGYRLGFKGPFAPLKKQQLPLDPRFVRHEDTPTSTRTQQPSKDPLTHSVYPAVETPGVEATCQSWKKKTTSLCNCPRLLKQTIQQVILASLPLIERSQMQQCLSAHWAWSAHQRAGNKGAFHIFFPHQFPRSLELLRLSDINVLMKIETFDGQSDFVSSIQP